jgi:broad specificity phosphatase PhoE
VHPEIAFIRHGETDWNAEARLQGQRDMPLNALGRAQAAEAGRKLRDLPGRPDEHDWIVSPLIRARETAEIARDAIGLPPRDYRIDPRLMELTFGDWEGYTWRELRAVDAGAVRARSRDKWNFVPPNGESYAMLHDRVAGWLEALGRPAVVVSHGGVARVLTVLLAGANPEDAATTDVWQGRVLLFRDGTAQWF